MTNDDNSAPDDRTPAVIAKLRSTRVAEPTFKISVPDTVDAARRARKIRSGTTATLSVAASVVAILAAVTVVPQLADKNGPSEVTIQAADSPSPGPVVGTDNSDPAQVSAPTGELCGDEKDQEAHPGLRTVTRSLNASLAKKYPDSWTGGLPCWKTNSFSVYRIPEPGLDDEARAAAQRENVRLVLVDTKRVIQNPM